MRRAHRVRGALFRSGVVAFACGLVLAVTAPAGASPATGCTGSALSTTGKGAALDKVKVPGAGGTTDDPFHVELDGKIIWKGETTGVVQNGSYSVKAFGASIASGKVKNEKGERSWSGTEDVGARLENVPVVGKVTKWINPTFTVKVDYRVASAATTCEGTVVLKVGDDPAFTPLWLLSIILFLLAFWMLFWPRAFFGG